MLGVILHKPEVPVAA